MIQQKLGALRQVGDINNGLEVNRFYGLKLSHLVIVQRLCQSR